MKTIRFEALIVVVGLLAAAGCGGGMKSPKVMPGTGPVGLPPVPPDIASSAYVADSYMGVGCADVPSGLNNCQLWLREDSYGRLVSLLEHRLSDSVSLTNQPTVEGSQNDGAFRERSSIDRTIAREAILDLSLRSTESPILALADGRTYALRVLVVREEADHRILTAMAEKAEAMGHQEHASRYREEIEHRYGKNGPRQSAIENVDRRVAEYFAALWEMTMADREKK